MPRIAWIEDEHAQGQLADCFARWRTMNPFGDGRVPDVFRAMSQVTPLNRQPASAARRAIGAPPRTAAVQALARKVRVAPR